MTLNEDLCLDPSLETLRREHQLLKEHYAAVWGQQKRDYIGEVAGKLRLLVADTSSAGPLLLKLFEMTNINPILKFNGPTFPVKPAELDPNRPRTLDEYLNEVALGTAVTGKYVELTNREAVLAWAQEDGSAHAAWQMNPDGRVQLWPFHIYYRTLDIYRPLVENHTYRCDRFCSRRKNCQ